MTEFTACNKHECSTQRRDLSDDIDKLNLDGSSPHHHSDSTMTLPPEVWAMVINYLPYDSLISCASTSRAILYDALPLVTTLHIEKSSNLQIGMISSKLRDVRSVSIYNLFRSYTHNRYETDLDENIALGTVHFLSNRFPHLESVTFWDYEDESCLLNYYSWQWMNEDQRGSIYQLLDSFSGAFFCKAIPPTMEIVGLRCPKRTNDQECKVCNRICKSFPLELVLNVDLCLPYSSSNEIIESRRGGRDYLLSEIRFLQLLGKGRRKRIVNTCIIIYKPEVKDEMNSFVESSQVDLSKLNSEKVVEAIMSRYHRNYSSVYLVEESFDYLKTLGLPISNNLLDPDAIRIENVQRMVNNIMDGKVLEGMKQISSLVSAQPEDQKRLDHIAYALVESGALPTIMKCLQKDEEHELQKEAANVMMSMTARVGKSELVIKLGAIPPLIGLLYSSPDVATSAAWALVNIAIDKTNNSQDLLLNSGVFEPLLKLLYHETRDTKDVRIYTYALCCLCQNVTRSNFNQVSSSLPTLCELIHHSDETVLMDICRALQHLSNDRSVRRNQTILNALNNIGVHRLITLLEHPDKRVQEPVLFTVGHLVSTSFHQAQLFIDNNVLPGLLTILSNENTNDFVTDIVCWIMYNILSSSKNRIIQAVIDSGIVYEMIPILSSENFHPVIRYKAVEMISCMARGGVNQVHYLVNQGCIPLLLETPTLLNLSPLGIDTVTETLERMFSNVCLVETYLQVAEKQQVLQPDFHTLYIPFIISKTVRCNRVKRINRMLQQSKRKRAAKVRQLRQRSYADGR